MFIFYDEDGIIDVSESPAPTSEPESEASEQYESFDYTDLLDNINNNLYKLNVLSFALLFVLVLSLLVRFLRGFLGGSR